MNLISNKILENKQVELEIQITAEEFKTAVDNAFKSNSKKIALPGFRKGKAPRTMIEKMYGVDIFYEDAINACYPKAYVFALEEAKIDPVDQPHIEIIGDVSSDGFTFKATVTVKPEAVLGEYKGITAEKAEAVILDEDVDAELSRIADRNARMIEVEGRAAALGDTTVINFEGFKDGVAFEGGKGEDFPLVLGSGQFIVGFEEQIVGHNINDEFDVNVTFPEEYHVEDLKGQPAIFKVKVLEIKSKELPTIDDEFAKDISEFDTIDELKADMKAKMLERKNAAIEDQFESALLEEIVSKMTVVVPDIMVNSRVADMLKDFEYRLSSQGLNLETYMQYTGSDMDTLKKTFTVQAEQQVKTRLALEAIAKAENFSVSTEEIEEEYGNIAKRFNVDIAEAKKVIDEASIAQDVLCNKALDFVKANGVVVAPKNDDVKKTSEKRVAKKKEAIEE